MSSKSDKEKLKQVQEKCQTILSQLLRDEDNKYCVDCDAKGPRWASWNLGIFLCIRCAGIHRNLGVHISKVKSVNLDTWTPEQVACLQQMGNSRARAVYEANLPDNFRRPQTDSSLEAFVRSKYETKKFIAKEWVPPPMPKPSSEFEEEKKKTKEKKTKSSSHAGLEVPMPKETGGKKSPSASPSLSDGQNAKSKSGAMIDLLGLNDPPPPQVTPTDDPFGGFLSATTSVATNGFATASTGDSPSRAAENGATTARSGGDASSPQAHSSDQENLFAQMSNEQLLQKKGQQPMSKESIMLLYGQGAAMQQPPKMMGIPGGGMFIGQPQQQQQQQANMFAIPGQLPSFGGYGGIQAGVGNVVIPGMGPGGMMPQGMVAGVPQGNVMGTNPFLVPGALGAVSGGWFTGATNNSTHPAFGQLQQQMASMSVGGQTFGNVSMAQPFGAGAIPQAFGSASGPQMPAGAHNWAGQQPGQTLSTNLWQ